MVSNELVSIVMEHTATLSMVRKGSNVIVSDDQSGLDCRSGPMRHRSRVSSMTFLSTIST